MKLKAVLFYMRVKLSFDKKIKVFYVLEQYRKKPYYSIMKFLQTSKAIDCIFIRLLKNKFLSRYWLYGGSFALFGPFYPLNIVFKDLNFKRPIHKLKCLLEMTVLNYIYENNMITEQLVFKII